MSSLSFRVLAGLATAGLATTSLAMAATADEESPGQTGEMVATGLYNPRHLTFAPNGDLYISESGFAGGDCVTFPPEEPDGEEFEVCAGSSGAVTRLSHRGVQEQVVTGLPSVGAGEADVAGPSDLSIRGNQLMITIGMGGPPAARDVFVDMHGDFYEGLASVQSAKLTGKGVQVDTEADLALFEVLNNPHPAALDTNPNAISADGNGWLLVDAGGNDVMRLDNKGNLSLVAVLPDTEAEVPEFLLPDPLPPGLELPVIVPVEPVPTSVERGPDGSIYVSQLNGFPFPVGQSSIWRIAADGSMTQWATGLTNVTDLTFGPDGSLYAVEIASEGLLNGPFGSLLRVGPGADNTEVIASGLFAPYGVAVYQDSAYVTTGAVLSGGGEVLRFDLD